MNRLYKKTFSFGNSPTEKEKREYLVAKNRYFLAIKDVKRNHWNLFLEKTDSQSIFKAMSYTKPRQQGIVPTIEGETSFEGKCAKLRLRLFPKPPSTIQDSLRRRWDSYRVGDFE